MNKINRITFIIFFAVFFVFLIAPTLVSAEAKWAIPNPRIPIPGTENIKDMAPVCSESNGKTECAMPWLSVYIAGIYKYAIGVVAILATVVMMIGGLVWLTSAGDSGRIGAAKQYITGALTGLVLVFSSYTILYFVNPDLVKLKPIIITKIEQIESSSSSLSGHCSWYSTCPGRKGIDYTIGSGSDCKIEDKTRDNLICCCPILGGTWKYDPGIEDQLSDASPSLSSLLNCLRSNLPSNVGRISSISDSAGLETCRDNYNGQICAHSENSCHYGGGNNIDGSYAVDIGDEENKVSIYRAIDACINSVENHIFEGTHIHISAKGCRNNY